MKIAVFSDSHGRTAPLLAALREAEPDLLLFLGDGAKDLEKIKTQLPQTPVKAVCGNCDYSSALPETELLTADGVRIFMTHGHLHKVKGGSLYALAEAADSAGASLALYGHTHRARLETIGSVTTLNPGSCGMGERSFALVVTDGVRGFTVSFLEL